MNILVWNCQGIVNRKTRHALKLLVQTHQVNMVFLSETKCTLRQHKSLQKAIGLPHIAHFDRVERAGGLALLWDDSVHVDVKDVQYYFIDVDIRGPDNTEWRFTGFYGHPDTGQRQGSWDLLRSLRRSGDVKWLVAGDFNEILNLGEKMGGRLRSVSQMTEFRQALSDCNLSDMGTAGGWFTWSDSHTKERLDRGTCSDSWSRVFGFSRVVTLPPSRSDHSPLLVEVRQERPNMDGCKRLFRFEEVWCADSSFNQVVESCWSMTQGGSPMVQLCRKVRDSGRHLLQWDRTVFNGRKREIEEVRRSLDALLQGPFDPQAHQEKLRLSQRLNELLSCDEVYWRQRSRAIWLKDGDRNSKFFHRRATNRRKRNKLKGLFDQNGNWQTSTQGIESVVIHYFQDLLAKPVLNDAAQAQVLEFVTPRVTESMNQILLAPYTEEEVKTALFQMHPSKAPGPDGMSPFFFQKYWDLVGAEVSAAVISFLTTKDMPHDLYFTHVVLIPKVKEVQHMSQLRPIALCNVIYKIASKVLANRLKVFLPDIISPEQSAFVPDRLIGDNTLVASELAHYMHILRTGQEGFMALKLDITKAYDRLDWGFLKQIMLKLGFDDGWVELIMHCLSSVRYSFLINGQPRGFVTPQRGLRQGDPISPYLFLLCAEGLSALISQAVNTGVWHGLRICDGAPSVSHLLFADDSMLYARATLQDCSVVKKILQVYEDASSQQVSLQKSSVVFSGNVPASQRTILAEYLGMEATEKHSKYLGIPTVVGQSRNDTFAYIKDNLAKKLTGWRTKLLSAAGREILIKVIAQAMPLYTMNNYLLPQHLIHELHQLCAKFWWGGTDEKRGMHWRAWDALCKPKAEGGMGFRHLFAFNLAMLAKQGWRIIQKPQSLPSRLLKAIYFPYSNFWDAELGSSPSYAWRSILAGRDILRQGIIRQVGDGCSTNIWEDPWLKDVDLSPFKTCQVHMVSELFEQPGMWNQHLLLELFPGEIVQSILALPISSRQYQDRWIWGADKKGKFTVKSAYHLARKRVLQEDNSPNPSSLLWNKIWRAPVLGKVKICAWKAASNILPTRNRLSERGIDIDTHCPFCEEEVESPLHALRDCPHASSCFNAAQVPVTYGDVSVYDWLSSSYASNSQSFDLVLVTLWAIWSNRNSKVWDDEAKIGTELMPSIMGWWLEYKQAHASTRIPRALVGEIWKQPSVGFIKLNVDAAFQTADGSTGLGGVFRDHEGNCLGCFSKFLITSSSPMHAELLALLEGIQLAFTKSFTPLIIETDCQSLVDAIYKRSMEHSEFGFLLADLEWSLQLLSSAQLVFIRRIANVVAHTLASLAMHSRVSIAFSAVPPPAVEGIIISECND